MSSHSGTGLTRFVWFYLIPCYCIFLLNTSNYSCFVAACRLLFFPIGIACLIFAFLLLYYMTSLLHLCLCRRNGTNCGQTMPKKWIIHCIHSFVSFFRFFFSPPSPFCPVPQKHEQLGGMTCFVGRALSWGTDSFFYAFHLPISQKPGIRHIWNTSLYSLCFSCIVPFEAEVLF